MLPNVKQDMRFPISLTALSHLATITTAGILIAGCGENTPDTAPAENDPTAGDPSAENSATAPETELTIEVYLDESGDPDLADDDFETGTWILTCSPDGGDHPNPEAACSVVEETGAEGFDEVPGDQICTHIYGGPERADVNGHVSDTDIDTEFSRNNGCEIDRFDGMGALLAP